MNLRGKRAVAYPQPARSPQSERQSFEAEVTCIAEDTSRGRKYLASNLSRGGVFVKTLLPLPIGDSLKCVIHLNDGGPELVAQAQVAWLRGSGADMQSPPGMGLRFVGLPEKSLARLSRFLEASGSDS